MKFYEKKLMTLKFDGTMHFFGEVVKEEIFKNIKYFELKEANLLAGSTIPEVVFVQNIWKLMQESGASKILLSALEKHHILFDYKLSKYFPGAQPL